ncbi:hypothetical protein EX30DRAFT_365113 [Ascodesmis nigricans]|uniref:NlpC/P60 domain-containing protein n=1 Tax=Ascodesmis nigricans TaxID=341454 RepID=A0A4S2MSX4_9PEZI|nr:hypothetical protein EX30DRAFT_365113 [Ascodesmis nigricans]
MQIHHFLLLFAATLAIATPVDIFERAVGGACSAPEGSGTCIDRSTCKGISYSQPYCPNDPNNIECCVVHSCTVSQGSGYCRSVSMNGCSGGTFYAGTGPNWPCPGSDDIKCCVKSSAPPNTGGSCSVPQGSGTCRSVSSQGCSGGKFYSGTGPNWPCPGSDDIQCCVTGGTTPPSGDVGARILAKAMTQAGLPYAWGGGTCSGPSGDQPPYDYGEIGFDCSGLVCYAVCQITGRNLFAEGLRNTHNMYCAAESTLKYKKYPIAQRKAGDFVFYGGACDCSNWGNIHHVGIVMTDTAYMWNAPNDSVNRVQQNSIYNFGETPCPYVIRPTA